MIESYGGMVIYFATITLCQKIFLLNYHSTVNGTRMRGRPILNGPTYIHKWTGINVCDDMRAATDRENWRLCFD